MCRTQYVLALVALYVRLAHSFSWDFVATSGSQLEFYFNERHTRSDNITSFYIQLITYDAVGNRIFFVDNGNDNTTIFIYDIITKKVQSLVPKKIGEWRIIKAIAFDPVEELLFWSTFSSNTIYSFSLKTGFENNEYGNILIKLSDTIFEYELNPAVDSCTGYVYWTSKAIYADNVPSTIERARFDGSGREVIIGSNLETPRNLVIDHQSQKMYWTDGRWADDEDDRQFTIESADFNGKNRTILYSETGIYQPNTLAVLNDYIYWVHLVRRPVTIYQLSKNPSIHATPKEISTRIWHSIVYIATNYKIHDQIQGIQECEGLKKLLPNNSVTDGNASLNISSDVSLSERCDVSVCQNYCFQGDCSVSAEEQPICRCNAGYSGERCQVNDCQGYCLNDGICSMNEESEPVCQCKGYYEGERCDVSTCLNKCFQKVVSMVPIPCPSPSEMQM